MSRSRREYLVKNLGQKLFLEALKEKNHWGISQEIWDFTQSNFDVETEAIKNISAVFNVEKPKVKSTKIPSEKLYARIGELTLENDFLKKSYSNL